VEEHDKEIQQLFDHSHVLEQKIGIFREEIANISVEQSEHDLLIKELVNESQENHKSIFTLTKLFQAGKAAVAISSTTQGEQPILQNWNANGRADGIKQSCLDVSDFNGLDDEEDNGIIEIQSWNSINSDGGQDEEIDFERDTDFKENLEEKFEQILEVKYWNDEFRWIRTETTH